MFDYSSNVDSSAKSFLHESQLRQIHGNIFARNAYIQSWGCHTGEEMSGWWYRATGTMRSEEHTSELQSLRHLVCRLLLEKKKVQERTAREHLRHAVTRSQRRRQPREQRP